jgi:hypothetical protein
MSRKKAEGPPDREGFQEMIQRLSMNDEKPSGEAY